MRPLWKVAVIVGCVVVACVVVIGWQHKQRERERRLVEAAQATRLRAEQGDAAAEADLAHMYLYGQGVKRDYDEAARWYRKSADQRNARGEDGIGSAYYYGDGVPQDYVEAARWYRKAADQGYALAERNLGDMYFNGYGFPQDYAEAARWYRKAAGQGDARAQSYLGGMYAKGQGVPQDRTMAEEWYRRAAASGDDYAQRLIGLRGAGFSTPGKIFLAINAFACFYLFGAYLKPIYPEIKPRDRRALAGAILFLCFIGLKLFEGYQGVPRDPAYVAVLFAGVHGALLGASSGAIFSVVWRRGAKKMLITSCVLFAAWNLLLLGLHLYQVSRHIQAPSMLALPAFYYFPAFPIGLAIPAIILLWLESKHGGNDSGYGGLAVPEPPAENGVGL